MYWAVVFRCPPLPLQHEDVVLDALRSLEKRMEKRMEAMEKRMEKRMEAMENRMEAMEEKIGT